jgi:hypothetical protein
MLTSGGSNNTVSQIRKQVTGDSKLTNESQDPTRTRLSGHDPARRRTGASATTMGSTYDHRKAPAGKSARAIRKAANKKRAAERRALAAKKRAARRAKRARK